MHFSSDVDTSGVKSKKFKSSIGILISRLAKQVRYVLRPSTWRGGSRTARIAITREFARIVVGSAASATASGMIRDSQSKLSERIF